MKVCEVKQGTGECNQYSSDLSILCVSEVEVLSAAAVVRVVTGGVIHQSISLSIHGVKQFLYFICTLSTFSLTFFE